MTATPRRDVTGRDLATLALQIGFAALLMSPVRHYVGAQRKVDRAKNDEDSFPLSTYPMFSADRRGRITVPHVIGISETGERVIPHYSHFGLGGLNQVRRQVSTALRRGQGVQVAQRYADSLARQRLRAPATNARIAQRRAREDRITEIIVVRSRFVFADYFHGETAPQAESVQARCTVGDTARPGPARPLPRFRA